MACRNGAARAMTPFTSSTTAHAKQYAAPHAAGRPSAGGRRARLPPAHPCLAQHRRAACSAWGGVPAYFDGPGGTQVPRQVLDAMAEYLVESNSNIEGEYDASRRTDELIARARIAGGTLVNGEADGIVFRQNATTLNFLLRWRGDDPSRTVC
jgi:selenocysteine lyase/cysteine desulfurase